MVLTARLIKQQHPNCKVVFVGPCAAKKLEASRRTIRSHVDFVLTFEEFSSILEAKEIDVSKMNIAFQMDPSLKQVAHTDGDVNDLLLDSHDNN